MTNYLQTPETRQQIAARSAKLLTDGAAFAKLAEALAAFEDATGRAVLAVESRTHADNPAAREGFLAFAKRRVAELDQAKAKPTAEVVPLKAPEREAELPVEPNGIELENAAQLEAEPIDTGSAQTVTAPQDAGQLRAPVGEYGPEVEAVLPADFWGAAERTEPQAAQDAPETAQTPQAAPEGTRGAQHAASGQHSARQRYSRGRAPGDLGKAHHGRAPDRRPRRKPARVAAARG